MVVADLLVLNDRLEVGHHVRLGNIVLFGRLIQSLAIGQRNLDENAFIVVLIVLM